MRAAVAALARNEVKPRPAASSACAPGSAVSIVVHPSNEVPPALDADWDALAARASEPNSFAERWFMGPALRHLAPSGAVRLLEARSAGTLIGLLPVCIARSYGRMPVRHVANWLHYQCFLGTPLVRAGHEQQFWAAVLDELDRAPWAPAFLHLNALTEHGPIHRGLAAAASAAGRPCDTVLRTERALLESDLSPAAYFERTVRKKKRKELKRLANRLAELGAVTARRLDTARELGAWCDTFLALERSGWKGRAGSALACSGASEAFFREALHGAFASGKLDFLRLDLEGEPLAMLVNFLAAPGSFSFKIAFDEDYARFSPGVLLQIENLQLLERPQIRWMDSCAVADHAMINSLWGERRALARVTVALSGARRRALFRLCRGAESLSAAWRSRRPARESHEEEDDD